MYLLRKIDPKPGGCDYQTRLSLDVSKNRFSENQRAVQIIHAPNHWQLLTREGQDITFCCSLGLPISTEQQRVIGHLMKLQEATKIKVTYAACQRQKKLNCGVHAIAMAVCFANGNDPSIARFSHELMRGHLGDYFENQMLEEFPPPKPKERIVSVKSHGTIEFKIPQLWHKLAIKSQSKVVKKVKQN